MNRTNIFKDINFYTALIFLLLTFIDISFLSILMLTIFLVVDFQKYDRYKNIFFVTVSSFYIARLIFSFSSKFDNLWKHISLNNYSSVERFWDLQLNLISMKCVLGNVENYYLKFSSTSYKSCPYSAKYGPLSTKVPFFGDIWIGTIILSIFVIIFLLLLCFNFYRMDIKTFITLALLLMTPSMNFLIERMNIDVFILIFSIICLYYYKDYPKFTVIVLLILSLYKIHPVGLLFGLLFFSHLIKNKSQFNFIFNSLVIFFVIYFLDSIFFTNTILDTEWRPAGLDITFGLLSDSIILSKYLNINYVIIYIVLLISPILLALFSKTDTELETRAMSMVEQRYFFAYTFLFLINFLYANYDYRLPLFIPLIFVMSKYMKNKIPFVFIFLMPLSLSPLAGLDLGTLNSIILIFGRFSIYYFYYLLLKIIKNRFLSSLDFSYLKDK